MPILLIAALILLLPVGLQAAETAKETTAAEEPSLLFVQSAQAMRFDGKTLTLGGIGPATVYFSDRPQRLAGLVSHQAFVALWDKNKEAFAADPPNAALAVLDQPDQAPVAVELVSVTLEPDSLVYKVRVLEGSLPAESGPVSLFVDHFHWAHRGGWGWGPGFGPWGPGFGPNWDSGFGPGPYGCGTNPLFGPPHLCR